MTDPDPSNCIGNDFGLPSLVVSPMLLLMRIFVVICDERYKLNARMVQQVACLTPKNISVRPNQIPLA